jgi:type I restriction enzyme S subunit
MQHNMKEDWIECELGEVCEDVSKVKRNELDDNDSFLYFDIGGIDNKSNKIVSYKNYKWKDAPSRAQQIIKFGDTLFSTVRTYLKNIAIVDNLKFENQVCSSGFTVIRGEKDILYAKYINYYSLSEVFLQPLNELQQGSSYPAVRDKDVFSQIIPLAPLPIQRAIVSKIEALFSDLDNGIANFKKAQAQLKIYRQAVLKKAFEGKFTNEMVDEGELPSGWKWMKISEISNVVRGGSPRPAGDPKYYDGNIPFLKVRDITKDNGIYLTTFEYTIKEAGLHKTRQIKPNTLLLSNSGATLGVPKICMIDATMNDGIAAFLNLDERSNLYLYYFWVSKTKELRNINMGAAQPNLNTDIIKNYLVPYCSLQEQTQIVAEIEHRLSVCDKVEQSITESLAKAEALRQSILKKAFEGQLLSQAEIAECKKEADYEPASVLLARIEQSRKEKIQAEKLAKEQEKKKITLNKKSKK